MAEEFLRVCPLCKSCVRSFYINFDVKIVMCENTSCDFPFGHEEVQYIDDRKTNCNTDLISISRPAKDSTTTSTHSHAVKMEIDTIDNVTNSEDQFKIIDKKEYKEVEVTNKDMEIQKKVQDLKGLTKEWNVIMDKKQPSVFIKNEKWIKNLMRLQDYSGVQLLKKQEMEQLMKEESDIGCRELKIDIDTNQSLSTIKIELMKKYVDEFVQDNST